MNIRCTLTAVLSVWFMLSLFAANAPAVRAEEADSMLAYVEAMQPGWNLGNSFDALGSETSWGNPETTQELIQSIASQGYNSIRIPITWRHRMGGGPDYTIAPDFLERIHQVVDWALDEGLYVMINLHHDSNWVLKMETERAEVLATFEAAWKQIAASFKDYPDKLMFEGINEPRFSEDWGEDQPIFFEMLDELNTAFHAIVRSSGGNNGKRPLVLSTLTGASYSEVRMDELLKTIDKLNDDRIIATIHYYGHYPFSVNMAGGARFDEDARRDVEQTFNRAHDKFVARGIPVVVGEYGLLGFDTSVDTIQHGEKLKYFEYVGYYAHAKKLTTMLWDNGQHFDRRKLEWSDGELYGIMKAGFHGGRSATAESDLVFVRKSGSIADASVKLNLNGHSLESVVRDSGERLNEGTDYETDGDLLTLKSSWLSSVIGSEYGEQASLLLKFSGGPDWRLKIVLYDTPRLKSVEGLSVLTVIPTQFNGDRLAMMEAVFEDGGNAGPEDWTPFKQYDKIFAPDYDKGFITLKKEFFQDMPDKTVQLKMHFWSGEIVDYKLIKEGSKVIGVSSLEPAEEPEATDGDADGRAAAEEESEAGTEAGAVTDDSNKDAVPRAGSGVIFWTALGLLALIAAVTGSYFVARKR